VNECEMEEWCFLVSVVRQTEILSVSSVTSYLRGSLEFTVVS